MRVYFLAFLFVLLSCNQSYFHSVDSEKMYQVSLGSSSDQWEKEEFTLDAKKSLTDILIVADTSESMYHHLHNLGRSLSDLLSIISDYDWQIGITSADHGDHEKPLGLQQNWKDHVSGIQGRFGGLMNLENKKALLKSKWLNSETRNYKDIFFHTLSHFPERNCNRPPYCHAKLEQPLRSLKTAMLRANLDNGVFFRPKADLVSLIITNEEERSEDRKRATKASYVVETFNKVFGHLDKKFIAFNILIMDEACLDKERQKSPVANKANSIAELAQLTGGDNISICSKDYGLALKGISKHIKNSLENSILLKKEPVPGSVQIEFEGSELAWQRYGRKIVFEKRGSKPVYVSIFYQSRH